MTDHTVRHLRVTADHLPEFSNTMEESLRAVRTNIQFCGDDIRIILFTSMLPDEGKSTVVMNLARSFAAAGKRILLIDSDMRNSRMVGHYRFRREDGEAIHGLSHYLSGQNTLGEVLYDTNIENLSIIFAGRNVQNSTELLEKEYFSNLLDEARREFDYILIDCAPMTAAIDAAFIARKCDGAVYVIAQNAVSAHAIKDGIGQLQVSGVRILGAVLNKVRMEKSRYYGDYYGKYYGHYYGTYGSKKDEKRL